MKKKVTHVEILNMYLTPKGVPPRHVRKVPGGEIHEVDMEITGPMDAEELIALLRAEAELDEG